MAAASKIDELPLLLKDIAFVQRPWTKRLDTMLNLPPNCGPYFVWGDDQKLSLLQNIAQTFTYGPRFCGCQTLGNARTRLNIHIRAFNERLDLERKEEMPRLVYANWLERAFIEVATIAFALFSKLSSSAALNFQDVFGRLTDEMTSKGWPIQNSPAPQRFLDLVLHEMSKGATVQEANPRSIGLESTKEADSAVEAIPNDELISLKTAIQLEEDQIKALNIRKRERIEELKNDLALKKARREELEQELS